MRSLVSFLSPLFLLTSVYAADPLDTAAPPISREEINRQLKREVGQTEFLSVAPSWEFGGGLRRNKAVMRESALEAGGAGERSVERSDVYAVDEEKGILYLLNAERGLQSVGFRGVGAEAVKFGAYLMGRSNAIGVTPTQMYKNLENDMLISMGRDDSYQDHLIAFIVENPAHPIIAKHINLEGKVAQSVKVGNILYLVISKVKDNRERYFEVVSYDLSHLVQVDSFTIPGNAAINEDLLNVLRTEDGKYYLSVVATENDLDVFARPGQILSSRDFRPGGKSDLYIIDISSEKGEITPLMQVGVRGRIQERTQVAINGGYLLVASNYNSPESRLSRIAVESFSLPKEGDELVSVPEYDYLQMLFDREVEKKEKSLAHLERRTDRDKQLRGFKKDLLSGKILADSRYGQISLERLALLKQGTLMAFNGYPKHAITVGSTSGENALVQDVRIKDGLLYVFWRPDRPADPLDVFDISQMAAHNGHFIYKDRLMFDGWVERSMPITFKGRRFILALGFAIPAVDNEYNDRFAQAILFEMDDKKGGIGLEAIEVARMEFNDPNQWSGFNGADKYIDFRFDPKTGKGAALYSLQRLSQSGNIQGGKLLGFDMNNALNEDSQNVFKEGSFLKASGEDLRRVFHNGDLDKIQVFTSSALSTYDVGLDYENIGVFEQMISAMDILRLANDVSGFISLGDLHLQVINERDGIRFRKVDAKVADGPLSLTEGQSLFFSSKGLPTYFKNSENSLLLEVQNFLDKKLVTTVLELSKNDEGLLSSKKIEMVTIDGDVPEVYVTTNGNFFKTRTGNLFFRKRGERGVHSLFRLMDGKFVQLKSEEDMDLTLVDGVLVSKSSEMIKDPEYRDISYVKNFMHWATVNGDNILMLSKPVNVPSFPEMISSNGNMVFETEEVIDQRVKVTPFVENGEVKERKRLEYFQRNVVVSTKMNVLASKMDSGLMHKNRYHYANDVGAFFILDGDTISHISFDENGAMTNVGNTHVDLPSSEFEIAKSFTDTSSQYVLFAHKNHRKVTLFKFDHEGRLHQLKLQRVGVDGVPVEEESRVQDVSYFYGQQLNFSRETGLTITRGLSGIEQFLVVE